MAGVNVAGRILAIEAVCRFDTGTLGNVRYAVHHGKTTSHVTTGSGYQRTCNRER
jgi:hypothetical protein